MNYFPMTPGAAWDIVNQYGARTNAPGFSECMDSMDENLFQLTDTERMAYNVMVHEMSEAVE